MRLADQVVVSDGGSKDGTPELARSLGAEVVNGASGRGAQLNRGARATDGDVILFLHGDTILPTDLRGQIEAALDRGCIGGGSLIRFDVAGPLLRFGERWINGRTRLFRVPLGDQAQFVTREGFEAVGGFQEWPILEDLDLIRRLGRHGRVVVLPGPVVTSSRRFRSGGVLATLARNWTIWTLFLFGVSPQRLVRLYAPRTHRPDLPERER